MASTASGRSSVALITAAVGVCLGAPSASANPFANQAKADDVFYHIMPIAWRDGSAFEPNDPSNYGDLVGVREGLPYLADLGVTAFWMNPVFPSPAYHGYQHGRADQINPWFGSEQDFLDLINASHALDIELYIDFVVYGISQNSPWFAGAFNNPSSPFDSWLAFENGSNTQYTGYTFNTWDGGFVGFTHWDLRNPDAADLVIDWSLKWLDPNGDGDPADGIDGYRLDHVWVNYGSGPDGWGYNLDDFWTDWHTALRELKPDVFTFAEQHDWGSHGGELLPQFNGAMTKPFEFAARDALWNEHAGSLYAQMDQTMRAFPAGAYPHETTFVAIIGDHDVDRLASSIGATSPQTLGRAEAAAAVLMLQPFPPIIYYGDEIAMTGTKQQYFSDADDIPMREPFKWNAVESAPMSRYHLDAANTDVVTNRFSRDNDGRSVEEQQHAGPLAAYKELIALRHENVALRRGHYHPIDASTDAVWAFLRSYEQGEAPIGDGSQSLVAAVNLSGSQLTTLLDLSEFLPAGQTVQASDATSGAPLGGISQNNASSYAVTIPAYGYALIEAGLRRPPEPPFVLDGQLDLGYRLVASSAGGELYAALDGEVLYLATQPASGGRDRFLFVTDQPGSLIEAPWAKAGQVAAVDAYVGNEADNNWSGWFDAAEPVGNASTVYLEAAIDLGAEFAGVPASISIAAASYFTGDGEALDPARQVPMGNGNTDLEVHEFAEVSLDGLSGSLCPAEYSQPLGVIDDADVLMFVAELEAGGRFADRTAPEGAGDFLDAIDFLNGVAGGCD